jgi:hypothetical protein
LRRGSDIGDAKALLLTAALAFAPLAAAQQSDGVDELAAQATDPTAALMSFQLNDGYTASLHDAGGTINQIVFRSAIPFDASGHDSAASVNVQRSAIQSPTPQPLSLDDLIVRQNEGRVQREPFAGSLPAFD